MTKEFKNPFAISDDSWQRVAELSRNVIDAQRRALAASENLARSIEYSAFLRMGGTGDDVDEIEDVDARATCAALAASHARRVITGLGANPDRAVYRDGPDVRALRAFANAMDAYAGIADDG